MHNPALFPINPEPQRLSPTTGFKEICDARLSKLTAISSTEFSMFICKQHLRIIALSFYSVKQKRGFFTKKLNFLYILTYLFICQSQRDRHCLKTLIQKRARIRACTRSRMYARQYNKNISFSIFSTNGLFGIF